MGDRILQNTGGYSALAPSHPAYEFDFGNFWKWDIFHEDFNAYDIGQAAGNPYTLTATNGVDTITTSSAGNSQLTLTLGGADNDVAQLQLTENPFTTVANKRFYFQARFNITLASGGTIAANELFIGLATEQTTTNFINAGGTALTVDNCIGFVKYDAVGTMAAVARVSDTESTVAGVITPTTGTFITCAWKYDGTNITFYAGTAADGSNLVEVGSVASDVVGALTPTLYIKAGEAKANVLNVDYYTCIRER